MFDEMGDEMTTPEPTSGWWRKMWSLPRLPVGPVVVALVVFAAFVVLGFYRLDQIRHEAAVATCESSNEFRRFMSSYLDSQVGRPIDEAPGFSELTPELQDFARSFAPLFQAGSLEAAQYAAQYRVDFPIKDCSLL